MVCLEVDVFICETSPAHLHQQPTLRSRCIWNTMATSKGRLIVVEGSYKPQLWQEMLCEAYATVK